MKKHIIFIAFAVAMTTLVAWTGMKMGQVKPHKVDTIVIAWLAISYLLFLVTFYITYYRPSWAIQKPKAEKVGTAQKRKQKRR